MMSSTTIRRHLTAAARVLVLVGTATGWAGIFASNLTNGQSKNWSDATAWSPAGGPPGLSDTATFTNFLPWAQSWTLTLDSGWAADTINVTTAAQQYNGHILALSAGGTVNTLNLTLNQIAGGNGFYFQHSNSNTMAMTQFNQLGTVFGTWLFAAGSNATWAWQNAAQITYFTGTTNTLAGHLHFENATSVNLQRSSATPNAGIYGSANVETIANTAANGGVSWFIGRSDNLTQTWTVGGGGHPVLLVNPSQYNAMIQKVGTGDVSMPDVDLRLNANLDGGISSTGLGNHGGLTAGGTIFANSLTVDAAASSAARTVGIIEHVTLDGQAGLNGGGSGNGRAFSAVTGNQNLLLQVNNFGALSTLEVGRIEIAPTGGEFYLGSTGTGKVQLNIGNNNRDDHAHIGNVAVTANTINFASPGTYLSDRCLWQDLDANANGILEFRRSFLNASTQNTLFRMDHTTLRSLGSGMFEAPSADWALAGPGTSNYEIASLILGKDATNASSPAWLMLQDVANNAPGTGAEALYVDSLQLFNGSLFETRGLPVYFKNSGSWQLAVPSTITPFAYGDGTGFLIVPEPGALGLLLGAGAWLLRRRAAAGAVISHQ